MPSIVKPDCIVLVVAYIAEMPKLWNDTIEAHRAAVREAILDTTSALMAEHGLMAVTMSGIAEHTGIGRATLYKYFPDVEAVLRAWHEREITAHLGQLAQIRDRARAGDRLRSVLEAYALLSTESHGHHNADLAAFLHRGTHVVHAQRQLLNMVRDMLADGAESGDVRNDVSPDELADYCLHALSGASGLSSTAAVRRLVKVTLAGLRSAGARDANRDRVRQRRSGSSLRR